MTVKTVLLARYIIKQYLFMFQCERERVFAYNDKYQVRNSINNFVQAS